ncbi:MAG: hypothetical protein MZV63_15020 [Marinilabiliales bacterium]|nr:hypothetical protein [Marinilabiliales bacterium]
MATLGISADAGVPYFMAGGINSDFILDTKNLSGVVNLSTDGAVSKGQAFNLTLDAEFAKYQIKLNSLKVDEAVSLSGIADLRDINTFEFALRTDEMDFEKYWNMFVPGMNPPLSAVISSALNYNHDEPVTGFIRADSLKIESLNPINAYLILSGSTDKIMMNGAGHTKNSENADPGRIR